MSWAITENLSADTSCEDTANHESLVGSYTALVKFEPRRFVVSRQHDHAAPLYVVVKLWACHEIDLVAFDFNGRITVKQNVCESIHFVLTDVATAARVADYVFRFQDIRVKKRKFADACHGKLQGNLASS